MAKTEKPMQFSEKLAKIASSLEKRGSVKTASVIDGINKNIVSIKYAQYVGIQNYWIRNSRCWGNCWRQKRSENTNLGAQEVWSKCYEEYLNSFNKSDSDWDKYAQDSTLIKTASKDVQDFIKEEAGIFHNELIKRVDSGVPVPVAVNAIIKENSDKYAFSIIDEANKLLKVAEKLKSKGKVKTAERIENVATEIIKEAGLWDALGRGWERVKGALGSPTKGHLNKVLTEINKAYQTVSANPRASVSALQNLKNYIGRVVFPRLQKSNNPKLQSVISTMQRFVSLPNTKGSGNQQTLTQLETAIRQYLSGASAASLAATAPAATAPGATESPTTTTATPGSPEASKTTEGLPNNAEYAVKALRTYMQENPTLAPQLDPYVTGIEQVLQQSKTSPSASVANPEIAAEGAKAPPPAAMTPQQKAQSLRNELYSGKRTMKDLSEEEKNLINLYAKTNKRMTKEAKSVLKQLKIKI